MQKLILGIDEVGRGPIAGPLVIGACVLNSRYLENGKEDPKEAWQGELTDSKALSERRREVLAPQIKKKCFAYGLGWVPAEELDYLGISDGLKVAARRAVQDLRARSPEVVFDGPDNFNISDISDVAKASVIDEIIIDGTQNFLTGTEYSDLVSTIIKADAKISAVSAASIIAKVARDHYMTGLQGKEFSVYEFNRHKGYGTALHWEKLCEYGPSREHRWLISRIKKDYPPRPQDLTTTATEKVSPAQRAEARELHLLQLPKKNTTSIGQNAENQVIELLKNKGHKILSHNFKNKYCEIDIVSATAERIYFTEVKYRSNPNCGSPAEAITPEKLKQMRFSAKYYMSILAKRTGRDLDLLPSPVLAVGTVDFDGHLDWFELVED